MLSIRKTRHVGGNCREPLLQLMEVTTLPWQRSWRANMVDQEVSERLEDYKCLWFFWCLSTTVTQQTHYSLVCSNDKDSSKKDMYHKRLFSLHEVACLPAVSMSVSTCCLIRTGKWFSSSLPVTDSLMPWQQECLWFNLITVLM